MPQMDAGRAAALLTCNWEIWESWLSWDSWFSMAACWGPKSELRPLPLGAYFSNETGTLGPQR